MATLSTRSGAPSGSGGLKRLVNHLRRWIIVAARKAGSKLNIPIRGPVGLDHDSNQTLKVVDREREVLCIPAPQLMSGTHPLFMRTSILFQQTWVREMEKCIVYGPTVGVVSSDNFLIPGVSIEWSCPPELHWTFRKLRLPTPTPLAGRSLILGSTGGDSYFHWMTDVLPRVRLIKEAGYEINSFDHFIINKLEAGYQKETLDYLKIPSKKIREIGTKPSGYLCEHAVLPSLPSFPGAVPPETIQYVRSIVPEKPQQEIRKLYIERGKSKRRRIPEEGRIIDWLLTQGFEIIDSGNMSVKDQATAFAHAEMIFAPHGGALTNLLFCRPGTKVVELLSSKYPNPCYRNLCGVAKLPYIGIIGDSQKSEITTDLSDSSGPIEIKLEDIKKALEQMSLG